MRACPRAGVTQDLRAGKLHQRVIGIINIAENRSPALIGRLVIELYVVACPAGDCVEDDVLRQRMWR